MAVSDEARHLLNAAQRDCRALNGMHDRIVFADEIFGFHAQQAVEKIFKAWLVLIDVNYPKTHDLSYLLSLLISADKSAELYDDLIEFNPYAVQFRYEAFDELGEPLDRPVVCLRIEQLLKQVNVLISEKREISHGNSGEKL